MTQDQDRQTDVLIVGAGQAGSEVATRLRQFKFEGGIVLVGDEPWLPYRRPPLSKDYLSGELPRERLFIRSAEAYQTQRIQCLTGIGATAIDREARCVTLSDGSRWRYRHLVLATGGRARTLPLAGADLPNVHRIRCIEEVDRLREQMRPAARLVVIGGGYIGLEAAAVAAAGDLRTTVVEAAPRLLARVASPAISAWLAGVHRRHGVDIRCGRQVVALEGADRVTRVRLDDGEVLEADLLVVGVGMVPNVELAQAAGLAVDDGILVDTGGRSEDPAIWAAGDCTRHANEFFPGQRLRLESVPNALEQARIVAENIAGRTARYNAPPWFWSDQHDLKLQMAGLLQDADQQVLRGRMEDDGFMIFHLRVGRLAAVEAVNRPQDFMLARQLLAARIDAPAATLADETVALRSLLVPRQQI